jgi:hypothetical protein
MSDTDRRAFVGHGLAAAGLLGMARRGWSAAPPRAVHLAAEVVSAPAVALPTGKRVPFGWAARAIAGGDAPPLALRWPAAGEAAPTRLRFTVAIEMRDERKIEARLPGGRLIGTFDVRYTSVFAPFEIALDPADGQAAAREGVMLKLSSGPEPLWVFTGGEGMDPALRPHLLAPGAQPPLAELLDRLASTAALQQFGWMEGCVLDAQLDLAALPDGARFAQAARRHLALFTPGGKLVYESPQSNPLENRVYGIEGALPFAALAKVEPQSPLLDLVVRFAQARRGADGAVYDGQTATSEGAYTVGYPLAVIARQRGDRDLAQLALAQLRARQAVLFDGQTFWRTHQPGNRRGNRHWARGLAWQLVGLARTLGALTGFVDLGELPAGLAQLAAHAQRFQRADGLWSVFIDEPALTQDTAGSAGIAAALALGHRHGWLPDGARAAALKTREGLLAHLTPDGFLGGASQSNKGGEGLQRGTYRVLYPMAMGLMGQLHAALEAPRQG